MRSIVKVVQLIGLYTIKQVDPNMFEGVYQLEGGNLGLHNPRPFDTVQAIHSKYSSLRLFGLFSVVLFVEIEAIELMRLKDLLEIVLDEEVTAFRLVDSGDFVQVVVSVLDSFVA